MPWKSCIGAQNGTCASSMPRLSAARSPPRRTSTSKPSSRRKVAKNGNRLLRTNSSVNATRGRSVAPSRRSAIRAASSSRSRNGLRGAVGQLRAPGALVVQRAAAAPGEAAALAGDLRADAVDPAVVAGAAAALRRAADEGVLLRDLRVEEAREVDGLARPSSSRSFERQQRDAERADRARVRRHDDLDCRSGAPRRRPARPRRTACPGRRSPGRPSACPSPGSGSSG